MGLELLYIDLVVVFRGESRYYNKVSISDAEPNPTR